jgi:hypothetical protein
LFSWFRISRIIPLTQWNLDDAIRLPYLCTIIIVLNSVADPGFLSRIRIFPISDPGFESENLSILTQKLFLSSRKYDLGCSSRILIFYPSRIPDPGVKKTPDPGSGSATLILNCFFRSAGLDHHPDEKHSSPNDIQH